MIQKESVCSTQRNEATGPNSEKCVGIWQACPGLHTNFLLRPALQTTLALDGKTIATVAEAT